MGGQAGDLREAGLTAYNHNLDTSPEFYSKITSSRKYEARRPASVALRGRADALSRLGTAREDPGNLMCAYVCFCLLHSSSDSIVEVCISIASACICC